MWPPCWHLGNLVSRPRHDPVPAGRHAINLALLILISPGAVDAIPDGAIIRIDLNGGLIICGEETFPAEPFPPFLKRLIAAGGLVPYVGERLAGERGPTLP